MRKLALDLGTKTCGFALSDENNIIALALQTIRFEENNFDEIVYFIDDITKKENIDSLVLGWPLRSNGGKSERTIMIENFAQKLKLKFPKFNIYLVNEYGSTIKSNNILKSAGISIKKRKKHKDTLSAVLILQEFLNYGGKLI